MIVLVTGASRGLGKAVAEKFASRGHDLLLSARNENSLSETAEGIAAKFPDVSVKYESADLSVKQEALQLGQWALEQGLPEVLVNNAGSFEMGSVFDEAEGALESMIGTNLYSAYHLTRSLIHAMIGRGSGHIFNMCSIASLKAYSHGGSYSISKHALLGFSRNLREEMKDKGIKVTAVLPGAVYTDSWAGSGVPPERIMAPNDIAELIYASSSLSPQACVEDIVIRPLGGDL